MSIQDELNQELKKAIRMNRSNLAKNSPARLIGKENKFQTYYLNSSVVIISDSVSGYVKDGVIIEIHDSILDMYYSSCSVNDAGYLKFDDKNHDNMVDMCEDDNLKPYLLSLLADIESSSALESYKGLEVHRFVWGLANEIPFACGWGRVHHKNGIKTDNRIKNLVGDNYRF